MSEIKVGDKVRMKIEYFWAKPGDVLEVSSMYGPGIPTAFWCDTGANGAKQKHGICMLLGSQAEKVESTETLHPVVQKPARVNLRNRMLQAFKDEHAWYVSGNHFGLTGNELAKLLDAKINSVTPRFAELRKLGHIKAHDILRRNGEIVWVLA